jgi:hypothetical protein
MIKALRLLTAVGLSLLLGSTLAQQYGNEPFFDNPAAHSHNFATHMMEVRFIALEAVGTDDEEFSEEFAEGLETDLTLIAGTLGKSDPELYASLDETLEELGEAAEQGADYDALLAEARELVARARAALLPAGFADDSVNTAALVSRLLLAEGGVAEGWEEAFDGEDAEYAFGWAALQHVKTLWPLLEPLADENQAFEITDQLEFLSTELFPTFTPPENLHLLDGEAAEPPTHRIVGFLEAMTDASLYPNRDLAPLVGLIDDLAVQACSAYAAGDAALGRETVMQSFYFYDEYLRRMLDLFDPELHAETEELFEELAGGASNGAELCVPLQENLQQVRVLFGA